MIEIIAECGVNHNGDLELAKEMVYAAKEAGADTVKFQLFDVDALVRAQTPLAKYQKTDGNFLDDQRELLYGLGLPFEKHQDLVNLCKKVEVNYLTSVFDTPSLKAACETLTQGRIKLGSGELTNYTLIKEIIDRGLYLILSTGMSSLAEVKDVLNFISFTLEHPKEQPTNERISNYQFKQNIVNGRVGLLHCTSQYPTPISEINLNNIRTLRKIFKGKVGLSDHSKGELAAITGVGVGIDILEKHFTISRKMRGPDHKASMEPKEFAQLVNSIRNAERALGIFGKKMLPIEQDVSLVAKKSIVANKRIKKGDKFSFENITVKRPGTGVSAKFFYDYIGKISIKKYEVDEFIDQ